MLRDFFKTLDFSPVVTQSLSADNKERGMPIMGLRCSGLFWKWKRQKCKFVNFANIMNENAL